MPSSRSNAAPRLTEAQFQRQVTELAELRGWQWAHFRPAMTAKGWRTPVSGPLGKGWPDLVLVRPGGTGHGNWTTTWAGRLIFAELKAEGGKVTNEQQHVLDTLAGVCSTEGEQTRQPVEVYTWTPADWDAVDMALR